MLNAVEPVPVSLANVFPNLDEVFLPSVLTFYPEPVLQWKCTVSTKNTFSFGYLEWVAKLLLTPVPDNYCYLAADVKLELNLRLLYGS